MDWDEAVTHSPPSQPLSVVDAQLAPERGGAVIAHLVKCAIVLAIRWPGRWITLWRWAVIFAVLVETNGTSGGGLSSTLQAQHHAPWRSNFRLCFRGSGWLAWCPAHKRPGA